MQLIKRILGKLTLIRLVEFISSGCLAAMFVVVMLGVFSRYGMASAIRWSEELARYLMIYMVFLGSTLSFRAEKHPALTFLIDKLSERQRRIWDFAIDFLVVAVLVLLINGGIQKFEGPIGRSPALRVRYTWVYLAIPLGGGAMLLERSMRIVSRIRQLLGRGTHES